LANIGPGAAATRICCAFGTKSARKCTERLLTRIGCAVDRGLKARQQIAAYALLVDAKDHASKAFCTHFGFKPLRDGNLTLCLPLGR